MEYSFRHGLERVVKLSLSHVGKRKWSLSCIEEELLSKKPTGSPFLACSAKAEREVWASVSLGE